ncbi:MAG: hypothetical protein IJJ96_07745, partial [Bacteroidales bacterium]|nr:hypothetical protein [Bacteroidales bacterium]
MKKQTILLSLLASACLMGCYRSQVVELRSDSLSLGFDRQTGKLVSFKELNEYRELIDPMAVEGLPWSLEGVFSDAMSNADDYEVTFKRRGKGKMD